MTTNQDENPLRVGMRIERTSEPCALVIFGATGDLTKRKLIPALFQLAQQRMIPAEFAVIGVGRQTLSDEDFRSKMRQGLLEFGDKEEFDESTWQSFAQGLFYISGDFDGDQTYEAINKRLVEI